MLDKARLGTRYTCFTCGTKFYDLSRPVPTCPECSADQREAPVRDVKALLSKGGKRRTPKVDLDDEPAIDKDADGDGDDEEEEEDDDDLGLLGDNDDDDDGGDDDDDD